MFASILLALASASAVDLAPLSFADAVRNADWIVYGEVVHVERVPYQAPPSAEDDPVGQLAALTSRNELEIAEVAIEFVLKGESSARRAVFLATRTWICDATRASLGERGCFFLADDDDSLAVRERSGGAYAARFGDLPLLQLVGSGQGKFLEQFDQGRVLLRDWGIMLPQDLPQVQLERGHAVEPALLRERIAATIVAQRLPLLTVRFDSSRTAGERYVLEVARDRSVKLSITAADRPPRALCFRLRSLIGVESALLASAPPSAESPVRLPRAWLPARAALVLHTRTGPLEFGLEFTLQPQRGVRLSDAEGAAAYLGPLWAELFVALSQSAPTELRDEFAFRTR